MQMLFSLTLDTFHGQLQKKKKKRKNLSQVLYLSVICYIIRVYTNYHC